MSESAAVFSHDLGLEGYEWWFGSCASATSLQVQVQVQGQPPNLHIHTHFETPLFLLDLPPLTSEEYSSDSDSPVSAAATLPPSTPTGLHIDTSLRLEKPVPVTNKSILADAVMDAPSDAEAIEWQPVKLESSPSPSSPSSPSSPDSDNMPRRKGRSNSLSSLYKDIDISSCKKTKKPATHRRGSVTIFSCPFPGCSRSFDRSFNLRAHYSTHMGIKYFTCEGCSKKFTRRFDVKRHQSTGPCSGAEILVDNQ